MKYFAIAVSLAALVGLTQGLNCWVCEDEDGNRAVCDGENEFDKECGPYTIGCVEEVSLSKESGESRTQRFCLESTASHKSAISSYFSPMIADRTKYEADDLAAKGCMRLSTDKYNVGVYACDQDNCNKDLDQSDCSYVCEENEARNTKSQVKQQETYDMPSYRCWSCTREENGEIINTLCDEDNMIVEDCLPGSAGCVEFKYTYGVIIDHELRHCIDRTVSNSSMVSPRDLIPIAAFDDEIYAKGCLKYYNINFTTDVCICDTEECNLDCDCEYECDNVASPPPL